MTGFVNINKPAGRPSTRETSCIKKLTGAPCGHMGTLDPMAEGVLPIGIGNACRLFDYLLDKHKTYRAVFTFG
ncbi:MAG: tRNA pseudouridine(55) synthase TruB, partial [Clostridia bacterium]|nr:tRNA pseudouridine(55) synthase TruB [Clostridia bacterium]